MLPRSAVSVPPPAEARRHPPPDPAASRGTPPCPPHTVPPPQGGASRRGSAGSPVSGSERGRADPRPGRRRGCAAPRRCRTGLGALGGARPHHGPARIPHHPATSRVRPPTPRQPSFWRGRAGPVSVSHSPPGEPGTSRGPFSRQCSNSSSGVAYSLRSKEAGDHPPPPSSPKPL